MKTPGELENRMMSAHAVAPGPAAHCGHCFGEGRDAALEAIEHGTGDLSERLKDAHNAPAPPGIDVHCGHCFSDGRDAAIQAVRDYEPTAPAAPAQIPAPPQPSAPAAKPVHLPKT